MAIEMVTVKPNETETYQVGYDDHCVVISSGSKPGAPKVWISKAMCRWLGTQGLSHLLTGDGHRHR